MVARRRARLSVARSAEGYKPRGRGLGQRNKNLCSVIKIYALIKKTIDFYNLYVIK